MDSPKSVPKKPKIVKTDQLHLNPNQVVHHRLVNHHNHQIQLKMLNHLIEQDHIVLNGKVPGLQHHHRVPDHILVCFHYQEQVVL
jgi:hypothetical protein